MKTGIIRLRVSPAERRAYEGAAQDAGVSLSAWLRHVASEHVGERERFEEILRESGSLRGARGERFARRVLGTKR